MIIKINDKNIFISDEYVKRLENNFEVIDEAYVKECISNYYTKDDEIPFVCPNIDEIIERESEELLNKAVNFIIRTNLEVMK